VKALVIDDDRVIRQVTTLYFGRRGIETITLPDGENAEELCRKHLPDLVVCDNDLGDEKELGIDVAIRLKKQGFNAVMHSGCIKVKKLAVDNEIPFVEKPALLEELLAHMDGYDATKRI
jgi:CheY-like chemotaxis protein